MVGILIHNNNNNKKNWTHETTYIVMDEGILNETLSLN